MSLQQKLRDGIQLVQRDRKAQTIAFVGLCALLFLIFHDSGNKGPKGPGFAIREQPKDALGASTAKEVYDDLQQVVVGQLNEQGQMLRQLQDDVKTTNNRIEENEIRTAEIFETIIKRVESQQPALPEYAGATGGTPTGATPGFPDEFGAEIGDQLESFGEVSDEGTVAPPPIEEIDERAAYIAPTDFVRVKLLAGVNAPTDGTPYPVLLELVGDVQSPDGASLPLGGARILAAAQGSLVDSRALFRLTTLTVRLPDGEVKDLPVDGWVVGEDGIRGLKGVPIDPLGKVLGATAATGFVAGAGSALSQAQYATNTSSEGGITSTFNGNTVEAALGGGLSQPARLWSNIIQERISKAVPVIQVYSGREATAIFSRGTVIPRLYEMLDSGEQDVFSGLD